LNSVIPPFSSFVIRDYDYTVNHPKHTGYEIKKAYDESMNFYSKLDEKIQKSILYIRRKNENKIFDELLQIKNY
jgi:flagellar biosynthesis chaperone FliJ